MILLKIESTSRAPIRTRAVKDGVARICGNLDAVSHENWMAEHFSISQREDFAFAL
jgi:hypothetical protein